MIVRSRFQDKWDTVHSEPTPKYVDKDSIELLISKYKRDKYVISVMRFINPKTLRMAYESTKPIFDEKLQQTGSQIYVTPGIDGITKDMYKFSVETNLQRLYQKLISKEYKMKPGLRTYVKKPNGKLRPITILCFEDNLIQKVIVDNILTPIYEEIFLDCSFGYRPNRNCKKAIDKAIELINNNDTVYIVEADIKSFFDNVNQEKLIEMLKLTIKDKRLISLIRNMMKAGYIDIRDKKEQKTIIETNKGIFQGGVLSPVLANIYLHYVLDTWINTIKTKEPINLIRYADDFIVLTRNKEDAQIVQEEIKDRFKQYDLELAPDKTGIVNINENGIKFLGFELRRNKANQIERNICKDRINKKREKLYNDFKKCKTDCMKTNIKKPMIEIIKDDNESIRKYYKDYIAWTNNSLVGIYRYFKETNNGNALLEVLYNDIKNDINKFFNSDEPPLYIDSGVVKEYLNNVYDPISYEIRIKNNRTKGQR